MRAKQGRDALCLAASFADFDQFDEVAQMQNGLRLLGFADQFFTAILLHAKARYAGNDA